MSTLVFIFNIKGIYLFLPSSIQWVTHKLLQKEKELSSIPEKVAFRGLEFRLAVPPFATRPSETALTVHSKPAVQRKTMSPLRGEWEYAPRPRGKDKPLDTVEIKTRWLSGAECRGPSLSPSTQAGGALWAGGQAGLYSEFQDSRGYTKKPCMGENQNQTERWLRGRSICLMIWAQQWKEKLIPKGWSLPPPCTSPGMHELTLTKTFASLCCCF